MGLCTTYTHQHPPPPPTALRHREPNAPPLLYTRHFTSCRDARPRPPHSHPHHSCGTDLLNFTLPPASTAPPSPTVPPSPGHPHTPPACQIPSGSPAGSCQALGPSPRPPPSHGRSLKATSFPHSPLSVWALFSLCFVRSSQRFLLLTEAPSPPPPPPPLSQTCLGPS